MQLDSGGGALEHVFKLVRAMAGGSVLPVDLCLSLIEGSGPSALQAALSGLDSDDFEYAVACAYTILMPASRRKELGAYFTRPVLVRHLVRRLEDAGLDYGRHTIHDPAAGGAAFIVPLVRRVAASLRRAGHGKGEIRRRIAEQLSGLEIEPGLAEVANALVGRALAREGLAWGQSSLSLVKLGDSLTTTVRKVDAIVGNPPFGKVGASAQRTWAASFSDILGGQLNLYAMFLRRSLDMVADGGLIGFVLPTSFYAGPEFRTLREAVVSRADVLSLDLIDQRVGEFLDVMQDACFLVLRRRNSAATVVQPQPSRCSLVGKNGSTTPIGAFTPGPNGAPWVLPDEEPTPIGGHTLADYGYRCAVGYFVANRQQKLLCSRDDAGALPVVRARCIRSNGRFVLDEAGEFVSVPTDSNYVIKRGCVAIQRTSNRKQSRRIYAASISKSLVRKHGGLVGENHVIFLVPIDKPKVSLRSLAALLNSRPVNRRFSQVGGTLCVSAKLLAGLDLPPPDAMADLAIMDGDKADGFIETCYQSPTMHLRSSKVRRRAVWQASWSKAPSSAFRNGLA